MKIPILISFVVFTLHSYSQTTKNAILWIGIDNPIALIDSSIISPQFISSDVSVTKVSSGNYIFDVTNRKSINQTIQIDLYDSLSSDTNKIISLYYLVKRVPDPTFSIAGKPIYDSISRSDLLKARVIEICLDDPDFKYNFPFELISFDMEIDGNKFHSDSKRLTSSMVYHITRTPGNKIRIMNDKVVLRTPNSDGVARLIYGDKTFILGK